MRLQRLIRTVSLSLCGVLACPWLSVAATFSSDFESGLPAGTAVFGTAAVVGGVLQLTDNANGSQGVFVTDPLDAGPVDSFIATFQARISDQTCCGEPPNPNGPADGFSLSFSNSIPSPPTDYTQEDGLPVGLSVNFDTWDNGAAEAPAIDVKMNGTTISSFSIHPYTGPRFVDVAVQLDSDGTIDVSYDGQSIFSNVATGHVSTENGQFVFGARTGGANSKHLIDNLSIETNPIPEPSTIALGLLLGGGMMARRAYARRNSR